MAFCWSQSDITISMHVPTRICSQSEIRPLILSTASAIVSQIIQERDSDEETKNAESTGITDLPSCLVGEIASNLAPMEYIGFSKTNRKIFVDSNTPNRLISIGLEQSDDYSGLRLHHYPQIEYFGFQLSRITELHQINGQIFSGNNQIQRIDVALDDAKDSDIGIWFNEQSRCFSLLSTLRLNYFVQNEQYRLQPIQFMKLLDKFRNLQSLYLGNVEIVGAINENQLQTLCPLVSELYLVNSYPIGPLLRSWGGNINILSFEPLYTIDANDEDVYHIPDCHLSALKRLHFAFLNYNESVALLNISKNASEISLVPNLCSSQEVESLINRCIARPKLEYLRVVSVWSVDHLQPLCKVIECGLNDTKDLEREWLEIAIVCEVETVSIIQSNADLPFTECITDIVKSFDDSKLKEWMFIVEFEYGETDEELNKECIQQLIDTLRISITFKLLNLELRCCTTNGIIVASKDCSMERHDMWCHSWHD